MPSRRGDEEARRLELAASQGDAEAQAELGWMRYFGDGVPQDFAEARRLYGLAAAQGDAKAQYNLGIMHRDGQAGPQDFAEARRLFGLAAAQGHALAQTSLGGSVALRYKSEHHQLLAATPDEDLLSDLPLELQLLIADAVGERCDRAALALASPRLLAACRGLQSYQGLEMSLAFHHVLGGAIDESVLRRYASRAEATLEGCDWLSGVAAATGMPGPGSVREAEQDGVQEWYLMQPDSTVGALLRSKGRQATYHYEGAEDAERLVRTDSRQSTGVLHYEGEKDAERFVRHDLPSGTVMHFEGEMGSERIVSVDQPCGEVTHYEGEKDMERKVRVEGPSLSGAFVCHFQGEKNMERKVRVDLQDYAYSGKTMEYHYEGETNMERPVRVDLHDGVVLHYDGAERLVRVVRPSWSRRLARMSAAACLPLAVAFRDVLVRAAIPLRLALPASRTPPRARLGR